MTLDAEVRVGVIGCGGMGALHAGLLAGMRGVAVAATMDADPARAAALAEATGATTYATAEAVIEAVDAVIVASPNETHPALVLAALKARKPVFCEKPLALTRADAEAIVAAEVAAGRRLVQVGFMRRYDPRHRELWDLVRAGAVGWPALVRGWHHSITTGDYVMPPEHALRSAMVHDFDSLCWLAGEAPAAVSARGALAGPVGAGWALDFLEVRWRFPSGALATAEFHARSDAGYAVGVEITAGGGTLRTGASSAAVRGHGEAASSAVDLHWFMRFADAYRLQARAWADVLLGLAPGSAPSAWDGLVSLAVAEAAGRSLAAGGVEVPVELPRRPALYN
ncbi:MAG: Gfo/Idh/MocA family oxidoreductase [Dehalococcoidia bacterium]